MRIEVQDVESEGDWILALVHYIGCGKGSGVEITQPSWELSMWQDGLAGATSSTGTRRMAAAPSRTAPREDSPDFDAADAV